MASALALRLLAAVVAACGGCAAAARAARGATDADRSQALLRTWSQALDGSGTRDTPVTRVVKLLKEMQVTLKKEMDEDEELYDKLSCWCDDNGYEKGLAISASESKIGELKESIEGLTAKSQELKTRIKELEDELAADKAALAEATALREKQQKEFHGSELDSIQAIENLKAALTVLSKHHASAPESTVAGGAIFKSERDSWESLLAIGSKGVSWNDEHEGARLSQALDDFMRRNGFETEPTLPVAEAPAGPRQAPQHDAGAAGGEPLTAGPSAEDAAVVRRALKSAAAFMQAHNSDAYYPAYNARSGEIVGVLKQLKEEMEADLAEAQKLEVSRIKTFAELRKAKTAEINSGYQMSEKKEDEFATTKNDLAEAKEDLAQEEVTLAADQKFVANLKETCTEASKNFNERKNARLQEIQAVSETIEILTQDDARDAMSATYNLLQASSATQHENRQRRQAAQVLRQAASALRQPQLSMMATRAELDAFTKVKKAIDDMIAMLKQQQADEVKKTDYCKKEIQENEMATSRAEDLKADQEAKSDKLSSQIQTLTEEIAAAKAEIARQQLELQRASEDRKKENLDFQKTVGDQTVVIEVLKAALDKLATYYDQEALVQKSKQTPPVPQMTYKPSKGASGVMELIEKLIQEAKGLTADAIKSESQAQSAYEQTVAGTNAAVAALQNEVITKTKDKAVAKEDKMATESDIADMVKELEGLAKYSSELHTDCDYVLKNFESRQGARAQEIEALQQAKQILSGASLS